MPQNYTIDFEKVDAAFQRLGDEGADALGRLAKALDDVAKAGGDLNEQERHYLVTNLVQQRETGHGPNIKSAKAAGAKSVQGFLIKTAVK